MSVVRLGITYNLYFRDDLYSFSEMPIGTVFVRNDDEKSELFVKLTPSRCCHAHGGGLRSLKPNERSVRNLEWVILAWPERSIEGEVEG